MSDCVDLLRTLPPVPPSVQSVLCALNGHPLTGAQLRESTGLPRRTVYAALKRIKELGILKERASLKDTRQTYFWVSDVVSASPGPVGAGPSAAPPPSAVPSHA